MPVDATIKMDDKTMDFMEPYNYKALEAFQKKYLSGFLGEMYNEQASHFENRAVDKIKSDSEVMMKNTMAGYSTISKTGEHINTKKEASNYPLFPFWV